MALKKVSILGISVTTSSRQDILSFLSQRLSVKSSHLPISQSSVRIVTPNPEQIVLAQTNEEFRRILNGADVALPDGVGVVWAMKKKSSVIPAKAGIQLDHGIPARSASRRIGRNDKKIERISGVDFMVDLCRVAAEKNKRVLFYGGRNGVSRQALTAVKQQIPNLDGIAEDGVEIPEEDVRGKRYEVRSTKQYNERLGLQHIIQLIRGRNIQVVFIGLGAPKQEFFMQALQNQLSLRVERSNLYYKDRHVLQSRTRDDNSLVLMSVGGSFDMLAGNVKRAPKVVRELGFEWLWRLIQEPWRWRRQLSLLKFFWLVMTK